MNPKATGHIRCADCRFATVDERASDKKYTKKTKKWIAYECGNPRSEYRKALLNVTPRGEKQHSITLDWLRTGRKKVSA